MSNTNAKTSNALWNFITSSVMGSVLLFIAAISAIVIANSTLSSWYTEMLGTHIDFHICDFYLFTHHGHPMTFLQFVNDALMAIFFLIVGLEIKRELTIGELSTTKKAILPVIAALGGMVIPVLLFWLIVPEGEAMDGLAIPMATDIAFALGVLSLLGKRVPLGLKIFLTALAVVDDLGGILVIAAFYSSHINYLALLAAFGVLLLIYIGGRMGVIRKAYYLGLGTIVWWFFSASGIHPSISGVLVAMMIPVRAQHDLKRYTASISTLIGVMKQTIINDKRETPMLNHEQFNIIERIKEETRQAVSPLQSIAEMLEPMVNFLILPLFAFVNAGIAMGEVGASELMGLPLAIFCGLFFGKALGIFSFSWASIRLGWTDKPKGVTLKSLFSVSILGGIGFTVALFISALSFGDTNEHLLNLAKIGIFSGSFIAGIVGYITLLITLPKTSQS